MRKIRIAVLALTVVAILAVGATASAQGATVIESPFWALCASPVVTSTMKADVAAATGVPEISPSTDRVRPPGNGSDPLASAQL